MNNQLPLVSLPQFRNKNKLAINRNFKGSVNGGNELIVFTRCRLVEFRKCIEGGSSEQTHLSKSAFIG